MNFLRGTVPVLVMMSSVSSALTVVVDYSMTSASLFDLGTSDGVAARAALTQAASDISAVITTELAGVNAGSGSGYGFQGVNGTRTATYNTFFTYSNPDDVDSSISFDGQLVENEFKVFAGGDSLDGSTAGYGGSGAGLGVEMSGGLNADAQGASDLVGTLSSTAMVRGGPVLNSYSGFYGSPIEAVSYASDFGAGVGFLSMDNDGSTDWHFDHTADVASGKMDFYSVALHEILHSLGYGASHAWDDNVSGMNWLGADAIADNGGSGVGLVSGWGDHIAQATESTRLSDDQSQQAVMASSITAGERLSLTTLDLAILRDLGYETIPEPSSSSLIGVGLFWMLLKRRR